MSTSTNVVRLRQPDEIDDPLTEVLRAGARRLLAQAVELEAEAFLAGMRDHGRAGRAGPSRPARPWSRANGPDRDRPGRGRAREDPGSRRDERGRPGPLLVVDPAALGTPNPQPRCALAGSLPARGLHGRLPGGALGPARPRRPEPLTLCYRQADGGVAG